MSRWVGVTGMYMVNQYNMSVGQYETVGGRSSAVCRLKVQKHFQAGKAFNGGFRGVQGVRSNPLPCTPFLNIL